MNSMTFTRPTHIDSGRTNHEAAGPQKTTVQWVREAMANRLNEQKCRDVANAVMALHRQHTRDGRPARFIPETE